MSFILDALKKSESERLRQDTPSIASIPQRTQAPAPNRWIWLVSGLLAVNLVALAGFMLWKNNAETNVTVPIDLPGQESTTATFTELVSEVKRNQPAEVADIEPPQSQQSTAVETTVTASVASSETPVQPGTVDDGLETFNNLRAKGVLQLPDMHLDIHVFSGEPEDRFVFVNMSKYKENGVLSEGPKVKAITAEGVVLEHANTTFLLPRE